MAKEKLTSAQVERDGDIEAAETEAQSINHLIAWINEARFVLDDLRASAQIAPGLADALRDLNVGYLQPEWNEETMEAQQTLLRRQSALIGNLARFAR